MREALIEKKSFHVFANNLFGALEEEVKHSEKKLPRYDSYRKRRDADSKFMVDIVSHLSRMSWTQLTKIIQEAITSGHRPTGLVTKSWTEAFLFAQHVVELALGVTTKDGTYRLTDLDVLVDWPVKDRKRPSKEDRMLNEDRARDDDDDDDKDEEDEDEKKSKSPRDDDEDEPKEKKSKKKKDDDEDEDSDGDADDEDEDEKPKAKKSKAEPKDDDDEDEDEKPKAKKSKPKAKDDEDEDEDEDEKPKAKKSKPKDDEDEDEDKKPKGKGGKVSKKGKKEKKSKDKSTKKAKPEKVAKSEMVEITKKSTVFRIGKRDKGGKKTKFLEIIPKNGIKVSELMDEAKEIGVKSGKVLPWLNAFQRYKFIKVG